LNGRYHGRALLFPFQVSSLSLFWYGTDVSLSRIWSGLRERNKEIRGRWMARERRGKRGELWRVDAREKVEVERERLVLKNGFDFASL
jgi:hypothetical protein